MISKDAIEFGTSAMFGAAVALTMERYQLSLSDPTTRGAAALVASVCVISWITAVQILFD